MADWNDEGEKSEKEKVCHFGDKCYRKNPQHIKEFHKNKRKLDKSKDKDQSESKKNIKDYFSKNDNVTSQNNAEKNDNTNSGSSGYVRPEDEDDSSSGYTRSNTETDSTVKNDDDGTTEPDSPMDVKENIKKKFLVEMPEDFYEFWEFCKSINKSSPGDALQESLGLQLVGPYDVLAGRCVKKNSHGKAPCYLIHWRYYYDPPEFLTVLRGDDDTQFHMGYFRDDPKEMPAFVASNAAKSNCTITPRGPNLFAAVSWHIQETLKKEKNATKKNKLTKLKEQLSERANQKSFTLEQKSKEMKARDKKVVCKSFHGAGIVVPVDANDVGYREVPETPGDLKKMFKKIKESSSEEERMKNFDPLMELVTLVQFANDECDYGEGLELGMDLFSYGGDVFHQTIQNLLSMAYMLLGRHEYGEIIKAHLSNRRDTAQLSEVD